MLWPASGRAAASDYDWQPARIAPDAQVAFQDRRGQPGTLAAFRGRPVLLNVWATWCAPCVLELPALDRLQHDYGDRLSVVALSVDRAGMPAVVKALRRLRVRHIDAYGDPSGDALSVLGIAGLPATMLLSASGEYLRYRRGRVDWDAPEERAALRAILKI